MHTEQVNLHWIWKETMNRLERFERLVQEGRALEPSVDFARYVLWSGIIKLCEDNPQPTPLKVDGAMLRWRCEELQRAVTERWRLNDRSPHLGDAELETLHSKLDKLAGYVARLGGPLVTVTGSQVGGHTRAERGCDAMLDNRWQESERKEDGGGQV